MVGIRLCLIAPPILPISGRPFYNRSRCWPPWAAALGRAKQRTKLNFSSLLAFQLPASFWIVAGETDEALFASRFAALWQGEAPAAFGTVPSRAYEDITRLLSARVWVWVGPFIASGAQRWDCAAAESSGSAEVGALAAGSFLFFMGEKSHSEYRFFPWSIKCN